MSEVIDKRGGIEKAVLTAIKKYKLTLDITYDMTLCWGPNGQGQLEMMYWVLLETPSGLLMQPPLRHLTGITLMSTPEQTDKAIIGALEVLREGRAKILNGQQQQ